MVLHTWNQRLEPHPHIHAVVPGSGPSLDGTKWVPCRYTQPTRRKPSQPFLVGVRALGHRFRDAFLRGERRLMKTGRLKVVDDREVKAMLDELQAGDWVVHIQPPPGKTNDPADVLKYLAR
jgi:hypothetical protein